MTLCNGRENSKLGGFNSHVPEFRLQIASLSPHEFLAATLFPKVLGSLTDMYVFTTIK